MSQILVGVLTGIASSLIASLIFIRFFVGKLGPVFKISSIIAKSEENEIDREGRMVRRCWYRIKFINQSRFPAYDVRVNLFRVSAKVAQGRNGTEYTHTFEEVPLHRSSLAVVKQLNPSDRDAFYAVRVRTQEDIESGWEDGKVYYMIEVTGCNALTGLRKCQTQTFVNPRRCLREGYYVNGQDLNVYH